MGQRALVLVPVGAGRARVEALAERFLHLAGVLEERLRTVHDRGHGDGVELHHPIAVLRREHLVQTCASVAEHGDVARSARHSAGGSDGVVDLLREGLQDVRLDARDERGDGRLDVALGELVDRQVALGRIELHVDAVLRADGERQVRLVLVLHGHDARALPARVLVGLANADGVTRLAAVLAELLVVIAVDGAEKRAFLVRHRDRAVGDHVVGDE
jgi:hypothetical protein